MDPAAFRAVMSRFPTGVAVVTTVDAVGHPFGMTCTSLASVTLDPPTLLVCLEVRSRTLTVLRRTRRFGVNLLHSSAAATARTFSAPAVDRFAFVTWRRSTVTGVPWLVEDAQAFAECRLTSLHRVGDHVLVVGSVVETTGGHGRPLLYGLRQYTAWPGI